MADGLVIKKTIGVVCVVVGVAVYIYYKYFSKRKISKFDNDESERQISKFADDEHFCSNQMSIAMEQKNVILSQDRTVFLQRASLTLWELVRGALVGRNRFCVLLLGRKAVGKTFLLETLCNVVYTTPFFKDVLVISLSIESGNLDRTPLEEIAFRLSLTYHNVQNLFELVTKKLQNRNKKVFLVLDKFQNAYKSVCVNGKQIISEIAQIGGSQLGLIYCIIIGSGSEVRRLAYAKLPVDKKVKAKYPHYGGLDINSTKYQPYWIYPFLAPDFHKLSFPPNADKEDLYLRSGGFPGMIYNSSAPYSVGLKGSLKNPQYSKFLLDLFTLVNTPAPNDADGVGIISHYMRMVSFGTDLQIELETIYDLTDKGIIRFYETSGQRIKAGFGSTMIFYQLLCETTNKSLFTAMDIAYMSIFHQNAEKVVFECIGNNPILLGIDKIVDCSFQNLPSSPEEVLPQCLYKDMINGKDFTGTDGVIFQIRPNNTLTVHCLQMKLGTENFKEDQLESVWRKWSSRKGEAKIYYSKLWPTYKLEYKRYLCTTKGYRPELIAQFKAKYHSIDVTVLDARQLKTIWPDEIKNLGKPFT